MGFRKIKRQQLPSDMIQQGWIQGALVQTPAGGFSTHYCNRNVIGVCMLGAIAHSTELPVNQRRAYRRAIADALTGGTDHVADRIVRYNDQHQPSHFGKSGRYSKTKGVRMGSWHRKLRDRIVSAMQQVEVALGLTGEIEATVIEAPVRATEIEQRELVPIPVRIQKHEDELREEYRSQSIE